MCKIKVIQAANTSDYDNINGCCCIEYWAKIKNKRQDNIRKCRATGVFADVDNPIVGGHVLGFVNSEPHVYITPILQGVNASEDPLTFDVDANDVVRVPTQDERAILSDPENQSRLKKLFTIRKMKELMGVKE